MQIDVRNSSTGVSLASKCVADLIASMAPGSPVQVRFTSEAVNNLLYLGLRIAIHWKHFLKLRKILTI